jgi:hypothetical protein
LNIGINKSAESAKKLPYSLIERSFLSMAALISTTVTKGTILPDGRIFVEKLRPATISRVRMSTTDLPFATINGACLYLKSYV